MIRIKRTYEPQARGDGRRILVERLWPRGMKKEDLHADAWMKDVAPSTELRQWFGHEVERWDEFRRRYQRELNAKPDAWAPVLEASKHGTVTLRVLVGPEGAVQAVEIEKTSGSPRLDAAAREAVRHWTFRPGTRNGVAQSAWALVPIAFDLTQL